MNNVKTLEKLHRIAELLPDDERKIFDYYRKSPEITKTAEKYADSLSIRLASLIADVEKDIRAETAKKNGNGNRQKAAERVIKSAITEQPHAEKLHGAWISKGKQCICDGFRVFRLVDALPLPEIPQNVKTMDADSIVNPARLNEGAMLDVPDAATLRAYIKEEKARKKAIRDRSGVLWDFGDGLPAVNAQYLLDALEILPGAVFFPSTRRPLLNAIYISSAYGDGVLLPVRVPAKMEAR